MLKTFVENFLPSSKLNNDIHKKILYISIPLILSNLTIPLLTFVDTAIIGHLGYVDHLAGITAAASLFTLIYGNFIFLRMGTTGLSSQAYGANDPNYLVNVFIRSIILGLLLGLLIIIFHNLIFSLFETILNLSNKVWSSTHSYSKVRIYSAPAVLMNFCIVGYLIGIQKTKIVLIGSFIVNGLNIALDYIFVAFFNMNVVGVALGTLISEWVGCIFGLVFLFIIFKRSGAKIYWIEVFSKKQFLNLLNINMDIFIRTFCLAATHIWFINRSSNLGDIELAINGILLNFVYISSFFIDGFAFTTETLVGESKGAKNKILFVKYVISSTFWCIVSALLCVIIFGIFGKNIINLLTNINDVKILSHNYLIWLVLLPIISVFSYQLDGIFTGATRTKEMRNGAIISIIGFIIATIILLPIFGNHGLWVSYILFLLFRAITLGLNFTSLKNSIND